MHFSFKKRITLDSRRTTSLLLLTALFFGVTYLVQVNSLSTKGYAIRELEKKIALQKKANERLHMLIIEAQSLGVLEKKMGELELVRSEKIEYVKPSQTVAVR